QPPQCPDQSTLDSLPRRACFLSPHTPRGPVGPTSRPGPHPRRGGSDSALWTSEEPMPLETVPGVSTTDLPRRVERQIVRRTWGRVHRLTIEVRNGRVIVRGLTPSYYVKQLAIQGCLEALGPADPAGLEVDIEVGCESPCPAR